jgi:hypothetical protein
MGLRHKLLSSLIFQSPFSGEQRLVTKIHQDQDCKYGTFSQANKEE